jgi:hypothetical protein
MIHWIVWVPREIGISFLQSPFPCICIIFVRQTNHRIFTLYVDVIFNHNHPACNIHQQTIGLPCHAEQKYCKKKKTERGSQHYKNRKNKRGKCKSNSDKTNWIFETLKQILNFQLFFSNPLTFVINIEYYNWHVWKTVKTFFMQNIDGNFLLKNIKETLHNHKGSIKAWYRIAEDTLQVVYSFGQQLLQYTKKK